MNIGLLYTPVSIFQMTRGALVLFVGILSVIFLQRRLHLYQWLALIIVMGGIAVVGLSGSLVKKALREHGSNPAQLELELELGEEDGPPPETSVLIGAFFLEGFSVSFLPASCLLDTRRREGEEARKSEPLLFI
jgi:drug/metabolite transporter (DMT)-like permease